MFGIGMTELLVILGVALIVFGPTRLPELARSLGRAMNEFRRPSTDLRQPFPRGGDHPQPRPPDSLAAPPPAPPPPRAPGAAAGPRRPPRRRPRSGPVRRLSAAP